MSGSHQFYTVTGRALPLPPKRTPSRHSKVLRLPTRRADQERSSTLRADAPGRVEIPHGGEFHAVPEEQRSASQLVVFQAQEPSRERARELQAVTMASSTASSVRRGSRHHSFAVVPSSHASSRHSQPAPHTPTKAESVASSRVAVNRPPPAARGSPTPRSVVIVPDTASSSGSNSPCLNRIKAADISYEQEAAEEETEREAVAALAAYESGSETQSIPMSSTRYSQLPEQESYPHRQHDSKGDAAPHRPPSNRSNPSAASRTPPPASVRSTASQRGAAGAAVVSPVVATNTSAAAAAAPPPPRSGSALASAANSRLSNSTTRRHSVDRHDHSYSQRKLEERRASRSLREPREATQRPPAAQSQSLALVQSPAVVRYTESSRPHYYGDGDEDGDPLEMNTPIAERVRQRSVASPARLTDVPAELAAVSGRVGGTELMPSLPRLQGRRNTHHDHDGDRTYRTVVRFIEYQPEEERPGLEAMLQAYEGREEELCELLAKTYGDDFEVMKSACNRGTATALIAGLPKTPKALVAPRGHADPVAAATAAGRGAGAGLYGAYGHYAVHPPSDSAEGEDEEEVAGYEDDYMVDSSRPSSTPRIEEGNYDDEEDDEDAHEMLTPALPHDDDH